MKHIGHHTGFFQTDTDYVLRALDLWKPTSFALVCAESSTVCSELRLSSLIVLPLDGRG